MEDQLFGYVPIPSEIGLYLQSLDENSKFESAANSLIGSGEGKIMLLHNIVNAVSGSYFLRKQTIGDCVSHGWGIAIDYLRCVNLYRIGEESRWNGMEVATESIYATSRVEVGRGRIGNSDGSLGAWAAQAVEKYGVLLRKVYRISDAIKFDLTNYSGQRAREWGMPNAGLPDTLEVISKQFPVKKTLLVKSYEEARDAIYSGFPVAVCSNQGFNTVRDSQGYARAQGSWAHCMCFIGVDDKSTRKGLLCMNSWGPNWITGPKTNNQPDGSFWVDKNVADSMLRINTDSYAVCDLTDLESIPSTNFNNKYNISFS